jgi:UDP-N-acetylmuramoylalanine--D-glutamate ligase
VPLDSPYIAYARKHRVPVYMSTALLVKLAQAYTVGITGTRGKTTVTQMIFETLRLANKNKKRKVYLGGNIQGMSTLALLPKVKKEDILVLELDSWQLQGFGDLQISPNLSVFTTFMPDHLNYYKNDLKRYFADKANIFKFQKRGDLKIIGSQVKRLGKKYPLPKDIKLQIPGEHNRYNAGLAYEALKSLKVSKAVIKSSLEKSKGVSGRLEFIKTVRGVKIYNDTTSTTPHALETALKALKGQPIILIAGGSDKNINLSLLKRALQSPKTIIFLPGSGTDRLIKEGLVKNYFLTKSLSEAVRIAFKNAKSRDVILLSPGFASFGLFKNEYDRGEQFVKAIKSYD